MTAPQIKTTQSRYTVFLIGICGLRLVERETLVRNGRSQSVQAGPVRARSNHDHMISFIERARQTTATTHFYRLLRIHDDLTPSP